MSFTVIITINLGLTACVLICVVVEMILVRALLMQHRILELCLCTREWQRAKCAGEW